MIRSAVLAAGGVCFAAQVVEMVFDRFSVLLSGHKAGQSFAGVGGNSTLCTKRISLVVAFYVGHDGADHGFSEWAMAVE